MRVYLLESDGSNYVHLTSKRFDDRDIARQFHHYDPMDRDWSHTIVEYFVDKDTIDYSGHELKGDFPYFHHIPTFSQHAVDVLGHILNPYGQLIPLDAPDETYYAFYPTCREIDAVDVGQSVYPDFQWNLDRRTSRIKRFNKWVFFPDIIGDRVIFRCTQGRPSFLFVTDEFMTAVNLSGLTGFDCPLLWTDEDDQSDVANN